MSTFSSNGEESYGINGIEMATTPVDQYIAEQKPNQVSSQNSYFLHPPSSPYNDFQKHSQTGNSNYQSDSSSSVVTNNPNLVACLSSKNLPPASELLPHSNITENCSTASVRMLPDSRQFSGSSGGSLPSISSLGQKQPMTPLLHNQPQPSPSIPLSPYINTSNTYYSLTEPGTPVTQVFSTVDHNIQAFIC